MMALPAAILMLIVLMVLPIPTVLLDILFVANIGLSIAVLMAAMNAQRPLDFSAFPSVLLFATLLRLALNVASTRIVLVHGHEGGAAAGQVIESFGHFLIGGNFAVGLFVFIILLIINMVVITKGASRVSEVSARFTLDALPGKQMAIDADIAAGLLTADEARARRAEVATEADFYGAMDGASKFVKGDAVAALLILGINLVAGFALGMISHGLSAGEAAEIYVTLAVGDALVAQVPALLLSIAAAVIVTRVTDARDLAGQIGGQFADPRAWSPVACVLAALGCIPAMPQTIFLPAAALAGWLCLALRRRGMAAPEAAQEPETAAPTALAVADVSDQTLVTLELGYGLVPLVDAARGAPLVARATGVRRQLSEELGFVVPPLRIRDSLLLPPDEYRVVVGGVAIGGGRVRVDRLLAIDAGEACAPYGFTGTATTDPSFGCPAFWIAPQDRDHAVADGFLVVDASTVVATHLDHLLRPRGPALLGLEEVRALLDSVRQSSPGIVEAITPDPLSLAAVTRLLRALLADGITLRHPLPVLGQIALGLQTTQDFDRLVDHVRAALGEWLVSRVCAPEATLPVITLDARLENAILGGVRDPASGQPVLDPHCARAIIQEVAAAVASGGSDRRPALIVQPAARRALADLLRTQAPDCLVLSIAELPRTQRVEVAAVIGAPDPQPMPALSPDALEPIAA